LGWEKCIFAIDHGVFASLYEAAFGKLKPSATSGQEALLGSLDEDPDITDVRGAAYMLATVKHECADRWQPIEEFGKGRNRPYGQPVTVTDADGTQFTNVYYGRGFVQLTWKLNYDKIGRALNLGNGLLLHPEHALEPLTAYRIMSYGMRQGSFTSKKLSDYIHDDICDYFQARRIINALDQAALIQGYAEKLEGILRGSLDSDRRIGATVTTSPFGVGQP
jgi:putative chitinase